MVDGFWLTWQFNAACWQDSCVVGSSVMTSAARKTQDSS